MSVIEDVRQVLQDFISPELRALSAKIDGLDKRIDTLERSVEAKIDTLERSVEAKIDTLERSVEAKIDTLERSFATRLDTMERSVETRLTSQDKLSEARHNEVIANFEAMKVNLQLNARLERLEAQRSTAAQ